MGSDSKMGATGEEFGADAIERMMRERIRETIEGLVAEELTAALDAAKSARVSTQRTVYRHGTRPRTVTTSPGPTTFTLPRARLRGPAPQHGDCRQWPQPPHDWALYSAGTP